MFNINDIKNGITFLYEGLQKNAPLIVKDWATIRALYPEGKTDII